jgi:hypothetical protein
MKKTFSINKNSHILIYGAMVYGRKLYKKLSTEGFRVAGFVDKRANEIENVNGLPVWTIENMPVNSKTVVILTIKNVFDHSIIAEQINKSKKCFKVICIHKPVLEGNGTKEQNKLASVHHALFHADIFHNPIFDKIPIEVINNAFEFKDYSIRSSSADRVLAYIPIEMIYSAPEINNVKYEWAEKNIMTLPHIGLFHYFDGDIRHNDILSDYVDFAKKTTHLNGVQVTEKWAENLIDSKLKVWNSMCSWLERAPDKFNINAEKANWNDKKKYFNLDGGRHRAAFLISRNFKNIPLKISKQDYEEYLNMPVINKLIEYIKSNNIKSLPASISHPYFYGFPSSKRGYTNHCLKAITMYISHHMLKKQKKIAFEQLSFLHIGEDSGALKRHFAKMGSRVFSLTSCSSIENLLNLLFYFKEINYISDIGDLTFDIVYIDREDNRMSRNLLMNILEKVTKFLFVESNLKSDYYNDDKNLFRDQGFVYTPISCFFSNGKHIEIGVIINNE